MRWPIFKRGRPSVLNAKSVDAATRSIPFGFALTPQIARRIPHD
jgi:hypothetical protein